MRGRRRLRRARRSTRRRWMAKSVPPPAIRRVALALALAVGQVEARLVLGRQRLDARGARQAQPARSGRRAAGTSGSAARHAVSVAPSSSACAAPWAMKGSIGWHASPSRVTRPRDHCGERRAVEQGPDERLVDRAQDLVQLGMPALEGGDRVGRVAGVGPRLPRPAVLLDDRHEVDQAPALDVVVDEVGLRAHPDLGGHLEVEVAQALGGHQPAIGGAAGEDRVLRAEQHLADRRVDAVGADQQVDLDRRCRWRTPPRRGRRGRRGAVNRWPTCRRSGGSAPTSAPSRSARCIW